VEAGVYCGVARSGNRGVLWALSGTRGVLHEASLRRSYTNA
jgi:hypothetical protein